MLIVRVMGEAGLRASEVTVLREQDLLELPGGRYQLRVIGKGNKERMVSLPPDLGRELRRSLRRRPGSGRIVLSRVRARGDYQPLDKNALTRMVERLGKTAEIAKPVHPHVLRHPGYRSGSRPHHVGRSARPHDADHGPPLHTAEAL